MWVNLKIIMKNHEDSILYDFILPEMMVSYGIRKKPVACVRMDRDGWVLSRAGNFE